MGVAHAAILLESRLRLLATIGAVPVVPDRLPAMVGEESP
jgi:hypothetical protein